MEESQADQRALTSAPASSPITSQAQKELKNDLKLEEKVGIVPVDSSLVATRFKPIIKSESDNREYRAVVLKNKLKVMLVSDPTTDKAAAAIDVHIGSLSDPWELPGLAHFCEHMLFMGTEKYPSENEYSKFISEHGGSTNAFTSGEHTNYHFDIAPDHLSQALDIFAQFFISPLFTEGATSREVQAIESEHSKNIPSDNWRFHRLEKHLAKPGHDYGKFGTGNIETLQTEPAKKGINVRNELLKFHQKWYSASLMTLSVIGSSSLNDLEAEVSSLFNTIPNNDATAPVWNEHPYGPEQIQRMVYMVPIKDIRILSFSFPIKDSQPHYKSAPIRYIGHLIGHEGKGSLLSFLKRNGWVNALNVGETKGVTGHSFFDAEMDLTEVGFQHITEIIAAFFQYVEILKQDGIQKWIFKELQDLGAMDFRFKDKEAPQTLVIGISNLLHYYPAEEVISAPFLIEKFDADLIKETLAAIKPENLYAVILAKENEGKAKLTEPVFKIKYAVEKISPETIESWRNVAKNSALFLPEPNQFIPENFTLFPLGKPKDTQNHGAPELIENTEAFRFWYKQDDQFFTPKAVIRFEIRSPLAYQDPNHINLAHMFVLLFEDDLTEYSYPAHLAGLSFGLLNVKYGMHVIVRGYNHKLHVLLEKVMDKLISFNPDPVRFEVLKEVYIRSLKNFEADQPYNHAMHYTTLILAARSWSNKQLLDDANRQNALTVEKLKKYADQLKAKFFVEGLIHGNVDRKNALEYVTSLKKYFCERGYEALYSQQLILDRQIYLHPRTHHVYEITNNVHNSSCVDLYLQCRVMNTQENVLLELFSQVIQDPVMDCLRTKEQLGYLVAAYVKRVSGAQGLTILVQSPHHPRYLDTRIETFLEYIEELLGAMSPEEFDRHKRSLRSNRLERPPTLRVQTGRYWSEIALGQYFFNRDQREMDYLATVTKEQLLDFYKKRLAPDAPKRRKIATHVISTLENPPRTPMIEQPQETCRATMKKADSIMDATVISDVLDFKNQLPLLPLAKPYMSMKVGGVDGGTTANF
ncbi:unnamed protein product [Notodromas monacha]|uniref:Insulin-degrading enzyme n=1 Tax=Notodromas monacha TaxID=399045 RepID=A0A7R9BJL1_9CRUS|nr:unnamed protein product [Notodromas monacha]CAG0915335.1 unnamed protein product [Notodromas monacha]